ncbi:unnamed protein product [Ceratitis capitata]|uniref:(Mediterranean fruit fly) hypothetical protein n=1 Tax=Ceratitis capitata TaxID=7213 RepID=A0A811V773_CERCA|nr:unnamed protein product [Ceratitis capitata]
MKSQRIDDITIKLLGLREAFPSHHQANGNAIPEKTQVALLAKVCWWSSKSNLKMYEFTDHDPDDVPDVADDGDKPPLRNFIIYHKYGHNRQDVTHVTPLSCNPQT